MLKRFVWILAAVASNASAGEKLVEISVKAVKAKFELGQAYASGSDADIWGQSSVSINFDPPLRVGDHWVPSLGAGIEGQSHSDAQFLNSFFDQGPHELDFEVRTESRLNWVTSRHECSMTTVDRLTVINNPVFKLEGFGGKEFDAYSHVSRRTDVLAWDQCMAILKSQNAKQD